MKIFIQKVYKLKWKIDSEIDLDKFFNENYKEFKFFGGDIDTLIQNIKYSNSRRISCNKENDYITAEDLKNALDKLKNSRKENTKKSKNKKCKLKLVKHLQ